MSIVVMKFGGTSVSNFEKIKNISKKVIRQVKKKKKVIVVVSAMGKTTDKLIKEYSKFSKCYFNPEYDNVISAGEQITSGLFASYLNENKVSSRSILGWQIPIKTDSVHGKARI